jgi:hypothetical protein
MARTPIATGSDFSFNSAVPFSDDPAALDLSIGAARASERHLASIDSPCVYRKSKSERIDNEVRPVSRANL